MHPARVIVVWRRIPINGYHIFAYDLQNCTISVIATYFLILDVLHLQTWSSSALWTVGVIPRKCRLHGTNLKLLGGGTARRCRELLLNWGFSFDCLCPLEFVWRIEGSRLSPPFNSFSKVFSAASDSPSTAVGRSDIIVETSCW